MKRSANEGTWVCIPCRNPKKMPGLCQFCGLAVVRIYYRIRLPKKNNDKAWALIEAGDLYWDKKHIEKKATRQRLAYDFWHWRKHER